MTSELGAKRLGLLLELRPQAKRIGFSSTRIIRSPPRQRSRTFGGRIGQRVGYRSFHRDQPPEIDAAFAALAQKRADGLVVNAEPLFANRRIQLATLAARHAVPTIYPIRDILRSGRIDELRASDAERNRLVGVYAGRILKGERPSDMPVQQPTAFELVFNLQTARALGLTVPPTLLARADEVIE